ncbi:UDP-Glycosyltransferase/glycogen phosphorylase [Punctularia strigosozonata HHB-11173 SS5]|uniref:UDP-Glycosyltransferase/glycogen phosphorylase n=1 Tax=Punctularia strigosozonata (strain HHB-11173) TaxID=741275 RepID=UPI0004416E02|nr:UDP-Glycosyltransferase/glycogen phosphorylase [Punctularia strigosozonata HHB-11173 SS5]EIN08845.1 UDP-Glycosyltransferase/glycogen phosphorylase [Punctularia strigosozonata HHB-11173 SS5]
MGAPSPAQHQEQVVPVSPLIQRCEKSNKLRIAIVAENFLPKVDGVTRTIARLLEYIQREGHEAILFVPKTQMPAYAGQPIADTFGVPLLFYPELQLGFVRPYFFSRLKEFRPDVIHFVDPNFLGAQFLLAAELGFGGVGPWTESGVGFVTSCHQSGEDLARHYASADVFCFPSFTETFGQVVSEALTSGLPVVGLEVEGTRDLVTHGVTGLLLPQSSASWGPLFAHPWSPQFADAARRYAELLMLLICDPQWRRTMGANAAREAAGRGTWGDAMEQLFLGYRRAIEEAKSRKGAEPACGHWMNSTRRVCVRSVSTTLIFLLTAVAIALCWMRNLAWIVILDAIARCRPGNRQ